MGMAQKIKVLAIMNNMTVKDLAIRTGTSQSNFSNKIKRDNFSEKDLLKIAETLDVKLEINFVLKDGTKI